MRNVIVFILFNVINNVFLCLSVFFLLLKNSVFSGWEINFMLKLVKEDNVVVNGLVSGKKSGLNISVFVRLYNRKL